MRFGHYANFQSLQSKERGGLAVPIELTCPNGHRLTAKDANAGRKGKCPVCKASVTIPMITRAKISESAIISILGTPALGGSTSKKTGQIGKNQASSEGQATPASASSEASVSRPHVKLCPSCEQEIDLGYHICPHCHTYIKGLNDF